MSADLSFLRSQGQAACDDVDARLAEVIAARDAYAALLDACLSSLDLADDAIDDAQRAWSAALVTERLLWDQMIDAKYPRTPNEPYEAP